MAGIVNSPALLLPRGMTQAEITAAVKDATFGACDVDVASATITYVGKEDKNGVWQIQRVDTVNGTSIRYATVTNNPSYLTYGAAVSSGFVVLGDAANG